jgi:hypothetical protein
MGRRRCTDRNHGGIGRGERPGRAFAERLESACLAGIPGARGIATSVRHSRCRADDQTILVTRTNCGGANRFRLCGAQPICCPPYRAADAKTNPATDGDSETNADARPDAVPKSHSRSMELRVVHPYIIVLHELLHQQLSASLHHLLRRQRQLVMHVALFW